MKDEKLVEVNPVVNQAIKEEKRVVASEGGKPSVAKAMEGKEEDEFKIPKFIGSAYKPPTIDLLERIENRPISGDIKANANIIRRTLQHFGVEVEMGEVNVGSAVTQYT